MLDLQVLEELRQLENSGSSWGLNALIDLFHKEYAVRTAQLREAIGRQDTASARRSAHALKGSAASLGARELASLCQQLELLLKENRLENLDPLLESVERSYRLVAPALNAHKSPPA